MDLSAVQGHVHDDVWLKKEGDLKPRVGGIGRPSPRVPTGTDLPPRMATDDLRTPGLGRGPTQQEKRIATRSAGSRAEFKGRQSGVVTLGGGLPVEAPISSQADAAFGGRNLQLLERGERGIVGAAKSTFAATKSAGGDRQLGGNCWLPSGFPLASLANPPAAHCSRRLGPAPGRSPPIRWRCSGGDARLPVARARR